MRRSFTVLALLAAGCSQSQEPPTPRTFERAGAVTIACLRVYKTENGLTRAVAPEPLATGDCLRTPANLIDDNGHIVADGALGDHLYGLVTQTARGEVAVVDLTAGRIVDPDRTTPGINFLPVGPLPTDIAATPDGKLTFVGSGEVNRPALFAIDNRRILGESQSLPEGEAKPVPTLPTWPVCALPARPSAIHLVEKVGDAAHPYDVVVVFAGDATSGATLAVLDPAPFLRGAGYDASAGDSVPPGSMVACPITAALPLSSAVPSTYVAGTTWSFGVPYLDAAPVPTAASACAPTSPVRTVPLPASLLPRARGTAVDGTTLYVADGNLPLVHVFDLTDRAAPKEMDPLLATSEADPNRPVTVGALAVSPTTRDFKRFLYAVDERDGSIMVFDLTASASPRVPMLRPRAELQPFEPIDRLRFDAPVISLAFGRADQPLTAGGSAGQSGLLCNPNPNAGVGGGPFSDPGATYRGNVSSEISRALGPTRFRGIFAFATLSNGDLVTIDVDDWDAPCRRPAPMASAPNALVPAQPDPASPSDVDPYHAPSTVQSLPGGLSSPVSLESFFPVSAPHRARSSYLLRRDAEGGARVPLLASIPQLQFSDSPVSLAGLPGLGKPLLLPTATTFRDPAYETTPEALDPNARGAADPNAIVTPPTTGDANVAPGVRFAWEDPTVHFDQDWTVTYEGALPGIDQLALTLDGVDGYQALSLSQPAGRLCSRGIEDTRVGVARAISMNAEFARLNLPPVERLESRLSDYVQIVDDILGAGDPYWSENISDCWSPDLSAPDKRQSACVATFGSAGDQNASRDFPVLEAYDDHLVVGTYFNRSEGVREYVGRDATNVERLKALKCCFHGQARFRVRTGSQWVAVGSRVGYLHHIARSATDNSCVLGCEAEKALLSSRAPALPRPLSGNFQIPGRESPLAFRNPSFAFAVWNGFNADTLKTILPARDLVWKFQTRGQFIPYTVSLGGANRSPVNPQTSRYLDILGSLAVVDGASQGLILLDVANGLATTHAPYF